MSKKIIIGNWKMNPATTKEAESLFSKIAKKSVFKKSEVVICPPFIYLQKLKKISKKISLGAQDSFFGDTGAFTGQVSAEMLSSLGIKYVILGHSERRELGEGNILINKKIKGALSSGLVPILCVGDRDRDENHEYFNFVRVQVEECLNDISKDLLSKVIIAYEPVWALSTTKDRKDATANDSKEMNIFIKKILTDKFGVKTKMPRIIYGGSVNEKNVGEFLQGGGMDGCLPGAASLNPEKFLEIIKIAESL
jgi:triosephosphate isomerase